MKNEHSKIEQAFRGTALYGDDFSAEEIEAWFEDEREGYFNLQHKPAPSEERGEEQYAYGALAYRHCFKWLPLGEVDRVLGVGSASGAELAPLARISRALTVLEPSEGFKTDTVHGRPVSYVKPRASGAMPFADASFDVVVCFSVLHHIPNVTTVVREMARVVKTGGLVLLREPTHSMGDWRIPRRGLTKRERGIPIDVFRGIIRDAGFDVVREARCMYSLTSRLSHFLARPVWTYEVVTLLDELICRLPVWSRAYHAKSIWQKLRPTAVAYVLRRA